MEELKEVNIRRSIATTDNAFHRDRYFKISGLILYIPPKSDKKKCEIKYKHKAIIK